MKLSMYQVDSFAHRIFAGNPAVVVMCDSPLSDELMLTIAAENNVSETAFVTPTDTGFNLRWFTPSMEVALCGHGTLAAAHIVFSENITNEKIIQFSTASGILNVEKNDDSYLMNFPTSKPEPFVAPVEVLERLPFTPVEVMLSSDNIVIVTTEENVEGFGGSFIELSGEHGVILTAQSDRSDLDVITRYFGFKELGIDEDPVTGAAHCAIVQYWCDALEKETLLAFQASARGGYLECERVGDRVILKGKAVTFFKGICYLDEPEGERCD